MVSVYFSAVHYCIVPYENVKMSGRKDYAIHNTHTNTPSHNNTLEDRPRPIGGAGVGGGGGVANIKSNTTH